MFQHEREVPFGWQETLDRICRREERISWLKLAWYPGMPYEPVQRWVVYEMIPELQFVPVDLIEDLRGEDPNLRGRWVVDKEVPFELGGQRWASESLVSHTQWKLFKETNCYPNLTWIIQGTHGGHPWQLSQAELGFFETHNIREPEIPNPGELDYADFDSRVAAALAERDKLHAWTQAKPFDQRGWDKTEAGIIVRRERKDQEEDYNRRMMSWLTDHIESAVSDLSRVNLPQPSDFSGPVERLDEEKIEEEFITQTATRV